jgi:hypothetical protein
MSPDGDANGAVLAAIKETSGFPMEVARFFFYTTAEKNLRGTQRCYILLGRGAQGGFDEITDKTESFLMDRYL